MDGDQRLRPAADAATSVLDARFLARIDAGGDTAKAFIAQVAADWRADELPDLDPDGVAALAEHLWRHGEASQGDAPAIRLVPAPAGAYDLLEIAQPDAPLLVDSVMGEVAEAGVFVRAMFHPVVTGSDGRRSLIQVVLEPVGPERREALVARIADALADVRAAVSDFPAMLDLLCEVTRDLEGEAAGQDPDLRNESLSLLHWMRDEHFVLLGARRYVYPRTPDGGYAAEEPEIQPGALGVLRDPARAVLRRASEPAVLSERLRRRLEVEPPVVVAKSNLKSRVHRRGYMDYVSVKAYGADGRPTGETRFVGLFTAEAYDLPASEVPLVRRKIAAVLRRAAQAPDSHNDKRLRNILETYPRDELFQIDEEALVENALGVLHLYDRPRVRLFVRRDPYDRFASVLLYVPRDRYDSRVRSKAGEALAQAFGGRVSAYYPHFSDMPLARVHFIIGLTPNAHPEPDVAALEARIAALARTWDDGFEAALRAAPAPVATPADAAAFPAGYRDRYDPAEALLDLAEIAAMGDASLHVRAFRTPDDTALQFRFKLYRRGEAAPLSDVLPILENMGLRALVEAGFEVSRADAAAMFVHEFLVEDEAGDRLSFAAVREPFEDAFTAVWSGRTENDGFNRMVLELGVSWREASLLRALARYRQQTGLDPTEGVQTAALSEHPQVARLILDLFHARLDPAAEDGREDAVKALAARIQDALQEVPSLDHDRVLRRLAALVQAIQRTNYWQTGPDGEPKPWISFKIASRDLADLPAPKPFREIFVWSPIVEGVHLRFGPVARGGLRWSDRRDDFRTEVLGLVKAQNVKNAVIVPVGSKGGFYPKALPRKADRAATQAAAIEAYKVFLYGLLDLTDNLVEGRVAHPPGVVVYDGDDPYLVVAADKGTASFSDIANGVAESYGFWLGDAFASGGSAGYDHKEMGITARGAWEAVKRHFRELGKDIQAEPFTVIGVGDMSGDVFGNGMLLSKQIKLLAAFDHRHIFLDPDPDPAASFEERKRLFELPTSSWADYDAGKISEGGGVFPRTQKSIPLSAPVKAWLGVQADALAPAELINAILKAKAELLYLGGVGTYVKARTESAADVGDKANDALRVNGADLKVQVVGEGANLGVTQAGRIDFARAGGRIDTDAIDNSAGVDSSDHEVNIKILTSLAEQAGELTRPDRDTLLASMTDQVAEHVLAHNYDQTLALSLMQVDAKPELDNHARFVAALEAEGKLDRAVEGLPDAAGFAALREAGLPLTRPELSVLLAYGKLDLAEAIVAGRTPDDPWFEATLKAYFPDGLARFEPLMKRHRLRREIIATVLDNEIVNKLGPTFPRRLRAAAACDTDALVGGFEAARAALDFDKAWDAVSALDGKASAEGQMALYHALANALRGMTFWLAKRAGGKPVGDLVKAYAPGTKAIRALLPGALSEFEREATAARAKRFVEAGAPEDLAGEIAVFQNLTTAPAVIDLARGARWPAEAAARLFHRVGSAFGFDRLRAAAGGFSAGDLYERQAVRRLIEDMLAEQAAVTGAVMSFAAGPQAGEDLEHARAAVASWTALRREAAEAARRSLDEIEAAPGGWTFAKLTLASAALRSLAG